MKTPYVPHLFGDQAAAKVQAQRGWLTVGVVSSIPWPPEDVWLLYDGPEYLLRCAQQSTDGSRSPNICTPCDKDEADAALSRLYRFVSILGYFKGGYVDITFRTWGGTPAKYVATRDTFTTTMEGSPRGFDCNYMPIIEDDQVRKALAFAREGGRLRRVHEPYSFLSYFKVIESQLAANDRRAWVAKNLELLTGEAAKRVVNLRELGIDVNTHLFDSCRCAVAHASISGTIVDPDIPADRTRIAADLDIMEALANRYIRIDAGVPNDRELYRTRDRIAPWYQFVSAQAVKDLRGGGHVKNIECLGALEGAAVSLRLWPDPPAAQFKSMKLVAISSGDGAVHFILVNARETIALAFAMDFTVGRMHTLLSDSRMRGNEHSTAQDVEDFTRYFHSVIANRKVEMTIDGAEPVECDIVIPVNIIPRAPENMVAEALADFRRTSVARAENSGD